MWRVEYRIRVFIFACESIADVNIDCVLVHITDTEEITVGLIDGIY